MMQSPSALLQQSAFEQSEMLAMFNKDSAFLLDPVMLSFLKIVCCDSLSSFNSVKIINLSLPH